MGMLDQHQDNTGTNFGFGQNAVIRYRGQCFTPTILGKISSIGFDRAKGSNGVKVYIDSTTNHKPTNPVGQELYSFTIPNSQIVNGFGVYDLPVPLALVPGKEYCFYLAPWNTTTDSYSDDYQDAHGITSVPGGLEITNNNGIWVNENLTFHFATYMDSSNVNVPRKKFYYKVYSAGSYVTTWASDVINEPIFKVNINNGPGELLVQLGRKFDDFGENVDVGLNNRVELWVVDKEATNGTLLYVGYISGYRPIIHDTQEYVEVTLLSYASEFQRMILRDGSGNTTLTYTSQDPAVIFKDIIDKYRAQGGSLKYSPTSIQLTQTVMTYTFNTQTIKQALDLIISVCPAGWFYRVDPDGVVYLQPKNILADNTFTLGLNVENLDTFRRVESVVNQVLFVGAGTPALFKKYSNSGSQATYGLYEQVQVDQRISDANTAALLANNILNNLNNPEIRSVFDIPDSNGPTSRGYDIESIKVGQTLKISNLKVGTKTSTAWDVGQWDVDVWDQTIASTAADIIQILSISYTPDSIQVEASSRLPQLPKRIEDVAKSLVGTQTVNNPTIPT